MILFILRRIALPSWWGFLFTKKIGHWFILLLFFFIAMLYIRHTMTHIEFVSQSPWPLMVVSVGAAVVYYAVKFACRQAEPTCDVPHQEIPQRDVPHDHFNEWQKHIRKETRKCTGYYRGKAGRK